MKKIILSLTILSIIGTTSSFGSVNHNHKTVVKTTVVTKQKTQDKDCNCKTCKLEKQKKLQKKQQQNCTCKNCQKLQKQQKQCVKTTPKNKFKR